MWRVAAQEEEEVADVIREIVGKSAEVSEPTPRHTAARETNGAARAQDGIK